MEHAPQRVSQDNRPHLLVSAWLTPPGGGSAVGAWTIQALRDTYDLTVLTWGAVDLSEVNRAFGTDLRPDDAQWMTAPGWLRRALSLCPLPLALLRIACTMRLIRRQASTVHFDGVIGAMNELDIGTRALQYIHYPWATFPRPRVDHRWYHLTPALILYRSLCTALAGFRKSRAAVNLTLANSRWTAAIFESSYGPACRVLNPPVTTAFPHVPRSERERAFVVVGRLAPEKSLERVIEILARVRERGHEVTLRIAGHVDNRQYAQRIHALSVSRGHWIECHEDLSREQLTRLIVQHRYGIHGMTDEHFGIAPAELQRAGCITFVPASGGPSEIVDGDERVQYHDVADAVSKICRVLGDDRFESELAADVERRAARFSTDRFVQGMRAAVGELLANDDAGKTLG